MRGQVACCIVLITTSGTLKAWFETYIATGFFLSISNTFFYKILLDRARMALICINQQDLSHDGVSIDALRHRPSTGAAEEFRHATTALHLRRVVLVKRAFKRLCRLSKQDAEGDGIL